MLSSDREEDQQQAQANPAKAQARNMLRMLCKFMVPVIQSAGRQRMDLETVLFGIEADEFVTELEIFISGIISRSQPRNQDIAIEATLVKEGISNSEEEETTTPAGLDDKVDWRNSPAYQTMIRYRATLSPMPLDSMEKALGENLQNLREYVTQKMPIRLLCFEPHNSKLKISLFERADVYNYLAIKFRADFSEDPYTDIDSWKRDHSGYAILSHTWNQIPGELTYGDWKNGSLDATQPKCLKLVNFCEVAWKDHDVTLGWIDTVCINKESSAELDESIRSMYAWYTNAAVCITYLAATNTPSDMHNDPWFTRGWTLQELFAPPMIKFYNVDWTRLSADRENDRENSSILAEIESATTITSDELNHTLFGVLGLSISRRMQLAAKRKVTRGEDIAYCLMGIFDVSISTAYGEGAERAFFRLLEEIFRSTHDVSDIFNWAGERPPFGRRPITFLFPSRPSDYLNRSTDEKLTRWHPIEPLTLTHLGLRTPILLMPAKPVLHEADLSYPLPIGDYHAAVSIPGCRADMWLNFPEELPENYLLLDKRISGPESIDEVNTLVDQTTLAFGTLNVEEQGTSIRIPKTCFALLLFQQVNISSPAYEKAYTEDPIIFDLEKIRNNSNGDEDGEYYLIEPSQLENHGMRLITLYL